VVGPIARPRSSMNSAGHDNFQGNKVADCWGGGEVTITALNPLPAGCNRYSNTDSSLV